MLIACALRRQEAHDLVGGGGVNAYPDPLKHPKKETPKNDPR